ncbi:MAG: hypothetical protein HYW81_00565 [Parcubacteria group bacterium]|nr:hypothetical protein [Parcubacteria group bacterium]
MRLFVPSVPFALVLLTAVLVASCIESALGAAAIMVAGCFFGIVAGAFTSDVLGIPEGLPGVN